MKTKLSAAVAALLALSGCATGYKEYAAGQAQIETARAYAEAMKYKAIAAIGMSGDEAAKVAAVMSMQQGSGAHQSPGTGLRAPESIADAALRWAQVFVPGAVQIGQAHLQFKAQEVQSNNSRILGVAQIEGQVSTTRSTNETMLGIAGHIQAPVTVVPQANITTTNTISGQGVIGAGSLSTVDRSINGSFNPIDNSQRNPIDNSQHNPNNSINNSNNPVETNNSNQNNPTTYPVPPAP